MRIRSTHERFQHIMITLNIPRIALLKGVQRPYTYLVKNGFTPQTLSLIHI